MYTYKYIELMENISYKDVLRVGGKGANLGEMVKAGFPIPKGFVVIVDAYKSFMVANNINSKIEFLLQALYIDDYEQTEIISRKIQQLFEEGDIPQKIISELDRAYEQIGGLEVAVRSSATEEDLSDTSFAGQYETYLNTKGKAELYQSIKKCWASLWNTRSLTYRLKQNINNTDLAQGIVVQQLINAEKSGILFTANPVNSRRDQMLLNASWGLGEAIVEGDVTPDQWLVTKKDHIIIVENIADKEKMTILKKTGTDLVRVPKEKRNRATLNKEEVHKLFELGMKAEKHFGVCQDIEWVFYRGEFYLVQARPITSLFPMLEPKETDNRLHIYMNFLMSNQATHEPLTPLGEDIWRKALLNLIFNRKNRDKCYGWLKSATGRLFVDVTELYRIEKLWNKLKDNPSDMDPITTLAMLQVLKRDKSELLEQRKPLYKTIPAIFVKLNPLLFRFIFASIPKTMYGIVLPSEKAVNKAYEYGNNQIVVMKKKRKELQTKEEKLEFLEQYSTSIFYFLPLGILYYVIMSFTYIAKARKILSKHLNDFSGLEKVEKALPHNVTTEMGIELLEIAKKLDQVNEQPYPGHKEVEKFLEKYGHRSCQEVDLGVPRWKEEPEYVISLIKTYIENKSYDMGIEKFNYDKEEADRAIKIIIEQLYEKGAHRDARRVEKLLVNYREMFGVREFPKFIMTKAISILREMLLEVGEELLIENKLDNKQDIFFVYLNDIKSGERLQELVEKNRESYQRELCRNPVPRVVTSTGEIICSAFDEEMNNEYKGIPVSPGIYQGRVKILNHPKESARLNSGDILVTKSTNPAWTPLFLKIGGLIMETGGPISHGSVVAREYGVPAIAGAKEATTRLKEGQTIRMNGETGMIEVLDMYI